MKRPLTLALLKSEARAFAKIGNQHRAKALFGVTDGKAVGTFFEHKFRDHLQQRYDFKQGNSALGIDFPALGVDMKFTSIRQPQSSCPFKSARQKIFGLGYSLLVFVYEKSDEPATGTGLLSILHAVFVDSAQTADFQTTTGLRKILENGGNKDDLLAFMEERMLPVEEIEASTIADELLENPPEIGYLTISNALQWRLQYRRIIDRAGEVEGVEKL